MTSRLSHTSIDSGNAYAQSLFWAAVLDYVEDTDGPNAPGHEECLIASRDGRSTLLFLEVPEAKQVKNRLDLDLVPEDVRRDEEVERVLGLGATVVDDLRRPDGTGWVVLADPEGNEFCILRSDAERAENPGAPTV